MHQPYEQTLLGHPGVRLQLSQEVVGSTITPGLEMDIYIYIVSMHKSKSWSSSFYHVMVTIITLVVEVPEVEYPHSKEQSQLKREYCNGISNCVV